ncbi:MAG: hypothetical protein HYS74_00650 [Parcubacteria group bacterium]|nr:hypothetical protein [Parcubacteria group bacterium]
MAKSVVFVAEQEAPSQVFARLADHIAGRYGHGGWLACHLGYGEKISSFPRLARDVAEAVCVLAGVSPERGLADAEVAACGTAHVNGIPYGLYADTWSRARGTMHYPREVRAAASFIFLADECDKKAVRKRFPNATVTVTGNPIWESFFFSEDTKDAARALLSGACDIFGNRIAFTPQDSVILCAGGTDYAENVLHFGSVMNAFAMSRGQLWAKNAAVVFAPHRRDFSEPEAYRFFSRSANGVRTFVAQGSAFPISRLTAASDLVVDARTLAGVEAMCLRKPVIDFCTALSIARYRNGNGYSRFEPSLRGAVHTVYGDTNMLAFSIQHFLGSGGAGMRERQELFMPRPERKGSALEKMYEALKRFF